MALVDLISEEVVKVPLTSKTKQEVLKELLRILFDAGKINDIEAAYQALLTRESKGSTGLEMGIAVPHAKCGEVKNLTIAIGISPGGIDFQALDEKPSHFFFIILAPPDQSGPHIEALAEIAKMTRFTSLFTTLMEATSAKEVVRLFKE